LKWWALQFLDKSSECDVLAGACFCQYDDEPAKNIVRHAPGVKWENTPYAEGIWQPSCFWRKSLVKRKDLVVRNLHFCMDRELWCYLLDGGGKWCWTDKVLSVYRFTGDNKSVVGKRKIILASEPPAGALVRIPLRIASRAVAAAVMILYPRERVRALQREFYSYSVW
jgi:hypothetical protein